MMTTEIPLAETAVVGVVLRPGRPSPHGSRAARESLRELGVVDPLGLPSVAEAAEAVIEHVDAPLAAAPALLDGFGGESAAGDDARRTAAPIPLVVSVWRTRDRRPDVGLTATDAERLGSTSAPLDEYAKAVLYNGLGHYGAARTAATRACERGDFALIEGALAELVEAGVRSGRRSCAVAALRRLEAGAQSSGSQWAMGLAACSRALLEDDAGQIEDNYREAIERLLQTNARVALARVRLLYGEWLRRQGRRVDAREQLTAAHTVFSQVGLGGFAERASREVLATGATVRKRTDDTRFDLTAQEALIAGLAAGGYTNPEIGERLFISSRTVEWHLRKVFTKLGVSSRKELYAVLPQPVPTDASV